MNQKKVSPVLLFSLAVILLSVVLRLLPHWPNFTPIAAMALFAGAYIQRKELAFGLPIAALLISDIFIGFHQTMIAVYAGMALIVAIGFLIRKSTNWFNIILASLASSTIFFLLTNFAVWLSGMVGYPMTFAGLMECYAAGIPFYRNALLGDLFYNAVFFGSYFFVVRRYARLASN